MKIHHISDIHIEIYGINDYRNFYKEMFVDVKYEDVIIFAGDIYNPNSINYKYFILDYLCSFTHHTIFITGNHEYYDSSIERVNQHFEDYDKLNSNFTFLNNSSIVIDNKVEIIGGTMWSNIGNDYSITKNVNDFYVIKDFTSNKINELYNQFEKYLVEKFKYKSDYTRIVVTHFQPSELTVQLQFIGSSINSYFNSGILDKRLSVELTPNYWIYGHDHNKTNEVKIGDITLLTNQFGYFSRYYNSVVPKMRSITI